MWFNNKCDILIILLAKYEEASVKTSYNSPYVYMISYFITNIIFLKEN